MQQLVYELKRLTARNRDGSLATQHDRQRILILCAEQLVALGYKQLQATEVKGRHIQKLVAQWKTEGISPGTFANRLAALRWWCEKVGRPGVMARHNHVYGVPSRTRISATSKAQTLTEAQLAQVGDAHVQMSLRLIVAFGLRRKESLMIKVHEADQGGSIRLQHNWTKNGLARTIPLTMSGQRETLEAAKALVRTPASSMIPEARTYIAQRRTFDYWVQKIGLGGGHQVRHAWAQARYAQLAGFPCPHDGGPRWAQMTEEQREADEQARQVLSQEMGHFRSAITNVYVGTNR